MTQIKKFAWSSAVVALAMAMAMTMLVQVAHAAVTTTTTGAVTISNVTNAANGTGAGTVLTTQPVITAATAATDIPSGTTVVVTAPDGWQITAQGTTTGSTTGTIFGAGGTGTLSADGKTITYTTTANNAAGETVTWAGLAVRPLTNSSATGNMTIKIGAGTAFTLATITQTGALTAPYAITLTSAASQIAADGTQTTTLTAALRDTNGAVVTNTQVSFSAGLGGFGATGAATTTAFTGTNGNATATYKGLGTTGTDTIVASATAPTSAVGTTTVTLAGADAGTATQMSFVSQTNNGHVAESAVTGYNTTAASSNLVFKVGDSNNTGVNGQVLLISVDKGFIGASGADCSSLSSKSVTATTAGTGSTAGRVTVTYCADRAASNLGPVTVTVKNVSTTTIANVTHTLTAAGVPATLETTVTPGQLVVTVKDSAGNLVADGTLVQVTIASTTGSVAPTTAVGTKSGKATFAFALTGTSGNAIVTVSDSGSANTLINQSVSLTSSTTPTTPPAGDGTLTAPSFGDGNVGSAVFAGGTVEQLAAQVTASGGTAVWVQGTDGNWYRYNTLATGATAFVNNAFNTQFSAGLSQSAVFVVK